MKSNFLLLLISVIFLIGCKNNNSKNTSDLSEINKNHRVNQTLIDSMMKVSYERGVFNGNILVAKNNKIIYQNELGYTDGSKLKKLSRNSIFNIGSIAKEFNAVALMILNEKGLLNLDDKISNFELQLPEWSNTISVRHLLQYTSGLPRINWNNIKNDQDIYNDIKNIKRLNFEPGTDYLYSNNNIFLQRRIVEQVSGMNFNDFIQKNLLIPGGMTSAIIDADTQNPELVTAFNNAFVNDRAMDIEFSGWVNPTANDMRNWIGSLHSGKLISKESLAQLFDSYSKSSESALGVGKFENDKLSIHQHHGSSFNYESFIHYNVKEDLSIVLMTNNKNRKLREITDAVENILKGNSFSIPQKSIYFAIREKCYDNANEGIQLYKNLKKQNFSEYNFSDENELNQLGYDLIKKGQIEDAISIFTLLISEFPNSSNAFDSMGEAYSLYGNNDLAIRNYKKSLQLNPNNSNAIEMIEKINKK
jgi:CubicO group peptidase (beta-lactamase class C family)